jgi:spore germination protein YaaH
LTRLKFAAGAALSLSVAASAGVAAAANIHHSSVTTVSSHHSTSTRASHPNARHAKAHRRHYQVKPGDSWWSIAHQFNTDWYNLAHDNGMQLSSMLHPGMVLVLPRRGEKPYGPAAGTTSTSATSTSAASTGSAPTPPASSTADASTAPQTSFEQCVIARESGGNPEITNGEGYWGLFQFSASTWAAYGGNPADFGSAPAAEQEQVFSNAMARGGESNWAPYDGC